jgi:DNA-binding PucR family transcriptional regulator
LRPKALLRTQAALCDRLLAAASQEYCAEKERLETSTEQRQLERVLRLLAGESLDTTTLGYDFELRHIGVIAKGAGVDRAIHDLAGKIDARLLVVRRDETVVWAWFGLGRKDAAGDLERQARSIWPEQAVLAIGEPGEGMGGWRLTHRQARAALPIAQRGGRSYVRYADAALLASMVQDDLLSTSLHRLYLAPLESERDGGVTLRRTLRAYFAAERNASSAAAALGVSRRTIANRLRTIEQRVGRPMASSYPEIEAALSLQAFQTGS